MFYHSHVQPPAGRRVLSPLLLFSLQVLIQILIITALIIAPTPLYRRVILYGAIAWISLYIITSTTTLYPISDFGLGCVTAARLVMAFDWVVLTRSRDELRPLSQRVPTSQLGIVDRVKWATDLSMNIRGIGWNFQISGLQTVVDISRWRFMRNRLRRLLMDYFIIDAIHFIWNSDPITYKHTRFDPSLFSFSGFIDRCHNLVWGVSACLVIDMAFNAGSALSVAIKHSNPVDWPEIFGPWGEAYTVRRLWSRLWHQLLRRVVLSHSNFVISTLRVVPSSTVAMQIRLWIAFLLSGILHAGGDYMVSSTFTRHSLPFFLLQAAAITAEEIVLWGFRKAGIRSSARIWGYLWVAVWLNFCSVVFVDGLIEMKVFHGDMLPFSVFRGVWGGPWFRPLRTY